ncbi:tRNA-specific adenosine deaminase 2 [Melipona quadrifasciata]|uniref:tRNA-specific adenosine deaminase 2 n=1 Tax=Melipona quadrifasciata TaxID=166423 RepID=A0A0N0BI14_9HYME|nr:tRNA-specific adenosine deaminase 2 [Melipona quadrifasciata]
MDILSWMDVALQKANESLKVGEVPVGCLFVYNSNVIAVGNNTVNKTHNATRHAEINCIDQVLEFCKTKNLNYKSIFYDIDVIVTVEPCIMCMSALCQLQVHNVIYGCRNDRFGGCISVFEVPKLYNSRTKIIGGTRGNEAMILLKEFYKGTNPNAPESKMKKNRKKKET